MVTLSKVWVCRQLACLHCRFETCRGHGCLVSCKCRVLSDRGPTDHVMSECDHEGSIMRRPWPTGGCRSRGRNKNSIADHYRHTWMYVCIWSCIANRCTLYIHGLAITQFMVCKIQYLAMLRQLQKLVLTEMIQRLCTRFLCDVSE